MNSSSRPSEILSPIPLIQENISSSNEFPDPFHLAKKTSPIEKISNNSNDDDSNTLIHNDRSIYLITTPSISLTSSANKMRSDLADQSSISRRNESPYSTNTAPCAQRSLFPNQYIDENNTRNDSFTNNEKELEEEREKREEEESEALARQLMAEEAMQSYNLSSNFLRDHATEYSEEDLVALQMAVAEEDPDASDVDEEEEVEEGMASTELSYETLLRLGDRIGDVKTERWLMKSKKEIEKLPTRKFNKENIKNLDENDSKVKCLVCQYHFDDGENVRILPCAHYFHKGCVDQWLSSKDFCPYCRQIITDDKRCEMGK